MKMGRFLKFADKMHVLTVFIPTFVRYGTYSNLSRVV